MEREQLHHEELVRHNIKYAKAKGIQIIQPQIQQSQDGCSIAAVSKQLDYQLRLIYAEAEVPTTLPLPLNGCLINHVKWQEELRYLRKCDASRRFSPEELLMDAKTRGAPLWNESRHVINDTGSYTAAKGRYIDADTIKRFLGFYPVVGVIAVKEDFSNDGQKIYEGKMKEVPDDYVKSDGQIQKEATHAVVLLDTHDINHVTDTGKVVPVTYVAYQNSNGNANNSMCPMGVSWLLPNQVVKEIHYGAALPPLHPPPALQSKAQISNHSGDLQRLNALVHDANEKYAKAEEWYKELVAYKEEQNSAEVDLALSTVLFNLGQAEKSLGELSIRHKVYENVNAAAQIVISDTVKIIDDVFIRMKEIKLQCLVLEKE